MGVRAPLQLPAPPHRRQANRHKLRRFRRRCEPALLIDIALLLIAGLIGGFGGWFLLDFQP